MVHRPDRRSFLTMTSAGATAALAGCSGLPSLSQDGGDEGGSRDAEAALTVQVQPDREELMTLQEELQAEVEEGETDETEAQQELQRKQTELTDEAVTAYEETASSDDTVSVEDSESEYGILRVDAPADTLVESLQNGDFAAILPGEYYDQYLQQQQQRELQQEMIEQQREDGTANESNSSGAPNESAE